MVYFKMGTSVYFIIDNLISKKNVLLIRYFIVIDNIFSGLSSFYFKRQIQQPLTEEETQIWHKTVVACFLAFRHPKIKSFCQRYKYDVVCSLCLSEHWAMKKVQKLDGAKRYTILLHAWS
jgi:hypothetical protein